MDFFQHFLGAEGCNVDGTIGNNPLTSFVDGVFDNHFGEFSPGGETGGAYGESTFAVFDEQTDSMQPTMQYAPGTGIMSAQAPMGPMMGSYPPPMGFAHPPPFAFPMHHPMNHQFGGYNMNQNHQDDYQYENDGAYEYTDDNEQYHEDDILHINDDNVMIDNTDLEEFGPSQQGLNQAWENLQNKLQSGEIIEGDVLNKVEYSFIEAQNNPFIESITTNNNNINDMMDKGMEYFKSGQIKNAILCFESIVQDNEGIENDEAWKMLGICHAENDEDKRAIYCYNKSLDCDPYNLQSLLALGTSYVNELNSIKALETLRTWVTHNPRYQNLDTSTFDAYSDGTLMDEVTQLMLTVSEYDPSDIDVKIVLGVLYNVSLDYDSAIECFSQACSMKSSDYSLVNKLAASYANSNQSELAIPHYARALQLRPGFARGWLNLGISFANMDRYEEAAKAYIQALHLNPEAKHIWSYMRVVLSCMDRFDLVALCSSEHTTQLASSLQVDLIDTNTLSENIAS